MPANAHARPRTAFVVCVLVFAAARASAHGGGAHPACSPVPQYCLRHATLIFGLGAACRRYVLGHLAQKGLTAVFNGWKALTKSEGHLRQAELHLDSNMGRGRSSTVPSLDARFDSDSDSNSDEGGGDDGGEHGDGGNSGRGRSSSFALSGLPPLQVPASPASVPMSRVLFGSRMARRASCAVVSLHNALSAARAAWCQCLAPHRARRHAAPRADPRPARRRRAPAWVSRARMCASSAWRP